MICKNKFSKYFFYLFFLFCFFGLSEKGFYLSVKISHEAYSLCFTIDLCTGGWTRLADFQKSPKLVSGYGTGWHYKVLYCYKRFENIHKFKNIFVLSNLGTYWNFDYLTKLVSLTFCYEEISKKMFVFLKVRFYGKMRLYPNTLWMGTARGQRRIWELPGDYCM